MLENPPKDVSLIGIALFERDKGGEVFTVWNHTMFNFEEIEKMVHEKSGISTFDQQQSAPILKFTKFKEKWIYLKTESGIGISPHLDSFSLCLFTSVFNPEKYFEILTFLSQIYVAKKSATPLLESYLNILTSGSTSDEVGSFNSAVYDSKREHLTASPLIDIIQIFEETSWIIWSALLMKKRVAVYSNSEEILQKIIRAMPLFVLHRQDWNLLRPLVNIRNPVEVADLTSSGTFVAGFTDNIVKQKEDLYDVLLDVDNKIVSIATHAEDNFVETKFHKEFSGFLTLALESDEVTDKKLTMAIKKRTGELIARLQKMKKDGFISFSSLSSQNLPPSMEKFLYAVASAEGMTDISS